MTTIDSLRNTIKICMFDQYGTVVDMQSGLTAAVTGYLKGKGWTGNPGSFVTWWRRTHFENSMIDALLHNEHTSYREIGFRSLSFVLDRAGVSHTDTEVRALVGEIERLRPFPEVPEALARLRTRYRLVVLSNGDPDMLEDVGLDEVLFIANHPFDCVGAKASGMRTAFINRRHRPFGITPHQPDIIVRSMTDLADLVLR